MVPRALVMKDSLDRNESLGPQEKDSGDCPKSERHILDAANQLMMWSDGELWRALIFISEDWKH